MIQENVYHVNLFMSVTIILRDEASNHPGVDLCHSLMHTFLSTGAQPTALSL